MNNGVTKRQAENLIFNKNEDKTFYAKISNINKYAD